MPFPTDFTWGAATAAYQIEGAINEDGRGLSVWDMLCRIDGRIKQGHSGAVACDHYHRLDEDLALMASLGLGGYRFSIAWPRILPEGTGAVNQAGLDFYDRLVDGLLTAGIRPFATLFHWDLPYELFCRGGWLNRDITDWFAEYASAVASRLGDRITDWMTFNEPQCFIGLGHSNGIHAPGIRLGPAEILRMTHHVLLAHGRGVQALRAASPAPCRVGIAPVCHACVPASDDVADVEAARARAFAADNLNVWNMSWWLDPVVLGHYPADGLETAGALFPQVEAGDMEIIAEPIDFIGSNTYQTAGTIAADPSQGWRSVPPPPYHPTTAFNWPVTPEALYWGPRFLGERYGLPIYITENGLSCRDWVGVDGCVHDPQRIDFTTRYLRALHQAVVDGAPVAGYFHWSLMDNFEWAEGYHERFGLIHVDFATGIRTPKDSAAWYRQVIASNGAAALD